MFEHVGINYYDAFLKKVVELLTDDGVMLLHSIGRSDGPNTTNPWIAKYIFPGGHLRALSDVLPAIERAGLICHRYRNYWSGVYEHFTWSRSVSRKQVLRMPSHERSQ